ncbi:MAG TPA: glycosyltransferase family 4 protein [Steroidobacteraceae bacterium]|nr:glycosyltransferase family 4 protein [Steroidobacteraceae bacterium]
MRDAAAGCAYNRAFRRIGKISALKLAYFVNEYPKVSHSFIRREILAIERQGFEVLRIALRGWRGPLPDEEDARERARTRYVLRQGLGALLLAAAVTFLRAPRRFVGALRLALKLSREGDGRLPYHLVYLAEACRILPWLRQFGASLVHAHFGTNSAEVALLAQALGGPPFSFTVHGPDEFLRPLALGEKVRRASLVVAISHFTRSQLLLRSRHEDWEKIRVVHCGLEPSYGALATRPLPREPRLVCVGRLCEAKGQLLLLDAVAQLAQRGVSLELVLAGDGPLRGELQSLIDRYGLRDRVRITGWISSDAVREQIEAARALVLPSFAEGLPVVLMEAMALARPVLSTYIAGIPELVLPGENGWLCAASSREELERALVDCLAASPERLEQMGAAGRARVRERHSIDVEAAKLLELFRQAATNAQDGALAEPNARAPASPPAHPLTESRD